MLKFLCGPNALKTSFGLNHFKLYLKYFIYLIIHLADFRILKEDLRKKHKLRLITALKINNRQET